eukprot:SM000291S10876  [mRNA]  locus=s291:36185:37362:- [translate_table: standard]
MAAGDGFSVSLPAKWNPSKESEFPGSVLRYEDNFDAVSNLSVVKLPASGKSKIEDYGSPEEFIVANSYLLGKQAYAGKSQSEGGFEKDKVSTASIFQQDAIKKDGKTYYSYEILTRTGDGTEGGRHQLVTATVSNGNLYILKIQAGDKRWFKGTERFVRDAVSSFQVA